MPLCHRFAAAPDELGPMMTRASRPGREARRERRGRGASPPLRLRHEDNVLVRERVLAGPERRAAAPAAVVNGHVRDPARAREQLPHVRLVVADAELRRLPADEPVGTDVLAELGERVDRDGVLGLGSANWSGGYRGVGANVALPTAFARYIAASALCRSVCGVSRSAASAMPMLAPIESSLPWIVSGRLNAATIRSAIAVASCSSWRSF